MIEKESKAVEAYLWAHLALVLSRTAVHVRMRKTCVSAHSAHLEIDACKAYDKDEMLCSPSMH